MHQVHFIEGKYDYPEMYCWVNCRDFAGWNFFFTCIYLKEKNSKLANDNEFKGMFFRDY